MNASNVWAIEDLELYADGELPTDRAEKLATDLRSDPDLRARFQSVCSLDGNLTVAMRVVAPEAPSVSFKRVALIAASILVTGVASIALFQSAAKRQGSDTSPIIVDAERTLAAPTRKLSPAFTVVLSMPASRDRPIRPVVIPAVPEQIAAKVIDVPIPVALPTTREFAIMLRRGESQRAADILQKLAPADQAAAFRQIGELFVSTSTAQDVLAALTVEQQALACEAWAFDRRVQSVAMQHLQAMRRDGATADIAQAAILRLARHSELASILRGYQLIESNS